MEHITTQRHEEFLQYLYTEKDLQNNLPNKVFYLKTKEALTNGKSDVILCGKGRNRYEVKLGTFRAEFHKIPINENYNCIRFDNQNNIKHALRLAAYLHENHPRMNWEGNVKQLLDYQPTKKPVHAKPLSKCPNVLVNTTVLTNSEGPNPRSSSEYHDPSLGGSSEEQSFACKNKASKMFDDATNLVIESDDESGYCIDSDFQYTSEPFAEKGGETPTIQGPPPLKIQYLDEYVQFTKQLGPSCDSMSPHDAIKMQFHLRRVQESWNIDEELTNILFDPTFC